MFTRDSICSLCWLVFAQIVLAALPAGHLLASEDAAAKRFTQKPQIAASHVQNAPAVKQPAKSKPKPRKLGQGPTPVWIWGADAGKKYVLQTKFAGGSKAARLQATCDNRMTIWLNGKKVTQSSSWEQPVQLDVQKYLKPGENELRADVANEGSVAGFVLKLAMTMLDGKTKYVVSDKSWLAAEAGSDEKPVPVRTLGKLGVSPWKDVFSRAVSTAASNRGVFQLLPGFQVELLYTVPKETQGSWVSLTTDNRGRLIASDQGGKGLYRITPPPIGTESETIVEPLDVKMTSAQGLLYAFDSLYVSVNGGPGSGLYRLRDTNGDDQYDEVVKLKALRGGGEHGPHALRLSPDGKSIYIVCGNHTDPPEKFDASCVPSNWNEDLLLPRQWDARGHARGKLAPGGWVAKTDPDGKTWEIISTGYRNSYDMDFNADGELFVYDADMEWDMGSPWYRPTRVVHAASGSEFGWRSGTGKWPTYFVDSLPPAVDIGPGSPVGAAFGYGAKFPTKYQRALYILDWTFGTMYAIHLQPAGASYQAVKEEFLSRTPLPLTDAAVGADGALYFTIGGRGTQSELYRVTYIGKESTEPADARDKVFAELRALRRKIEAYHRPAADADKVVEFLWPHLAHSDRHIRYAARVALEHQDVAAWQHRALAEKDPQSLITASVALARQGDKALAGRLTAALEAIDFAKLNETQQLELLRAFSLVFIRLGEPDQATAARLAKTLDGFYPAADDRLNRRLCSMLVYLKSPTVITKTLKLLKQESDQSPAEMAELLARNSRYGGTIARMLANQPELQKLHYAFALRNLRYGWTLEQRREYFAWLAAARERSGGASYQGFIDNARKDALANASPAERAALESSITTPPVKPTNLPKPTGPGHDWKLAELLSLAGEVANGRDFENGRKMFAATRCVVCHRFDGSGGATGPDLTNAAGRFQLKDLAEAMVDPSKVVSDQYRASVVVTTSGKVYTGRVAGGSNGAITVLVDPEDATKVVEIAKDEIDELKPSKVSLMPADLLKPLNKAEVLDLLAYVLSRGNPDDAMFAK